MEDDEETWRKEQPLGGGGGNEMPFLYEEEEDLVVDEEMLAEVMRRLEDEINVAPSQSPPIAMTVSSSMTQKRKRQHEGVESCGSSFSDSASTVMASIDVSGVSPAALVGMAAEEEVVWDDEEEEEEEEWMMGVLGGEGGDGGGEV